MLAVKLNEFAAPFLINGSFFVAHPKENNVPLLYFHLFLPLALIWVSQFVFEDNLSPPAGGGDFESTGELALPLITRLILA